MALALSVVLSVVTTTGTAAPPPASVDFSRDVLPILSDKCFRCHGPDPGTRKADLRLDRAEDALRKKDPVIVPGQSEASELIVRIKSDDAEETMPPPKSNLSLNAREVAILERWVEQGAEWGKHWAFVAPRRQAVPQTKHHDQARNGIDLHVLARLEQENVTPAPEATREALIRRVTLDLTGLPPTPTEIDAFLADPAPDAYERVVDRLLNSPRYGERMATHWLDLARYADTHGYQSDRYRAMWPWRDWVVRAFNGNQPFDAFLTWQLAGDLLPQATKEQRLATAFNRLHMQNEEGGVVEEEFRVAYVVDRVNTMATAFLGLTFECARCHDHKYDPITQRDFYSLYAFFQNIDESGQTSFFTPAMPVPTLLLSDDATDQKIADLDRRIAVQEVELRSLRDPARSDFQAWLTAKKSQEPPRPTPVASFAFDAIQGGKLANTADPSKPANASEEPALVAGKTGQAVELNGENGFTFPGVGHFSRVDSFSIVLNLQAPARAPRFVVLHHSRAPIDAGSRGYEILLEEGRVAVGLHHMWPGNALKVVTREPIPTGPWVHLAVTYDGSSRANGIRIDVDGVAAPLEVIRDGLVKDITYEGGEPDLALGFRFRDNGFKGGRVDDLQIYPRALSPLEVAHLAGRNDLTAAWSTPSAQLTAGQRVGLLDLYLASVDPEAQKQVAELHALRLEQSRLVNPIPEAMVMNELPRPKPAFVLKRGAYDAPGDPVAAGTPAALPSFPSDEPRNRLGLAHWLLRPDHPLTARVTVNRLWQLMFGTGIVETSDNFGSQGAQPSHPELLDWLALEFVDSGWDVKQLLRLMATSSTYRQSSKTSRDLLARDPENHLLARGPARRLTAEMLRDQALASSGLLTEWRGGPSVKPYQPDGLWEVAMGNNRYDQSKGPDLYRRSLYTFWKRTVPHPAMIAFDAAERNVCVVRRQSTSTPLQALTLLNDEQIVEAARHLGQRMLKEGGTSDGERVAWLFRLITGRRPVAREVAVLEQLLGEQRALFGSEPKAAQALLAVGETKSDPAIDPVELAAATVLAEAILNHDEAVLRR
ncbi:Concanavalin A-like lectin/glucanases superfamily protein [Singulisphaera sp. GP187]|nr:Concanavalin A-like lectin/glucanases superfamily protein [Singulisphaera sp. GP187]